ncbi:MAG: M2 family metallopeptidase [Candidatus Marinimicrobia bacterium]|nr:M2 family metallopeptidase [Candidatus Neomarinimicrobiota bacterium]
MVRNIIIMSLVFLIMDCDSFNQKNEQAAQVFVDSLTNVIKPLNKAASLAYWEATASGQDEYYARYANTALELATVYSNPEDFKKLKNFHALNLKNQLLARQIEILFYRYLSKQIDTTLLRQITELQTNVEARFNKFRGKIDRREVTGNDIKEILVSSNDLKLRQKAWEASKQVAPLVEADMLTLARLRNQAAQKLGFENYQQMALITDEQDPAEIDRIFRELEAATREPFMKDKAEIDAILAARFEIKPEELRPWHYSDPFFQDPPAISEVNLDKYYENHDVVKIAQKFYAGIGLDVSGILAKSDLYERPGKYPHAYCTDIDREGDVRVMGNVRNNEDWMATTLHELGHAVFSANIDRQLPYFLREEAHLFTTEAIAMFFEKLSKNPTWMRAMLDLNADEEAEIGKTTTRMLRIQKLVFARWALVMYNFEKALYENPEQDLNVLWWDLVEKYQMLKRPEDRNQPDWAAKIHICSYPVYYHNYQLGELLAAQLAKAIARSQGVADVTKISYVNNTQLGNFLKTNIFAVGRKYRWDEMIVRATGEKLTAKYFVEQL